MFNINFNSYFLSYLKGIFVLFLIHVGVFEKSTLHHCCFICLNLIKSECLFIQVRS